MRSSSPRSLGPGMTGRAPFVTWILVFMRGWFWGRAMESMRFSPEGTGLEAGRLPAWADGLTKKEGTQLKEGLFSGTPWSRDPIDASTQDETPARRCPPRPRCAALRFGRFQKTSRSRSTTPPLRAENVRNAPISACLGMARDHLGSSRPESGGTAIQQRHRCGRASNQLGTSMALMRVRGRIRSHRGLLKPARLFLVGER